MSGVAALRLLQRYGLPGATSTAAGIVFGTPVTTTLDKYTSTTFNVNIPSGLATGDVCLVVMRAGRSPTSLSTPSGWNSSFAPHSTARMAVYWRTCDGTEGTTISITQTSDGTTATTGSVTAIAWEVTGVAVGGAYLDSVTWVLSEDPPSHTTAWGSDDNVFLAGYSSRYSDWVVGSYPTNYSALGTVFNTPSPGTDVDYVGIAVGQRLYTSASDDPGAFVITAGASGVLSQRAFTLALRPAV